MLDKASKATTLVDLQAEFNQLSLENETQKDSNQTIENGKAKDDEKILEWSIEQYFNN